MNYRKMVWSIAFVILLLTPTLSLAQLKAKFSFSPKSGCSPLAVSFSDSSIGSPVKYFWRFNNGNTSILQNPGAIYYKPGKYSVTLIVQDAAGNIDSTTVKNAVNVLYPPSAGFSTNTLAGCIPLNIEFKDTSKKGNEDITSWIWDFGDGSVSKDQNPKHTYTNAGKFTITLIVKDRNGCSNTLTRKAYIMAGASANASIIATDTFSCTPPFKTTFSVKGIPTTGYTMLWDFGDGSTSTNTSPNHTYNAKGGYTVKLTILDSLGCKFTVSKSNFITIGLGNPDFTADYTSGCTPLIVKFTGKDIIRDASNAYTWKFGDGDSSKDAAPIHTYLKEGKYKVTLFIKNKKGCSDTVVKSNYINIAKGVNATFYASDTFGCALPFHVNFRSYIGGGTIEKWDFGDSTSSTLANPTHTYKRSGLYTIKLYVRNPSGCISVFEKKDYVRTNKLKAKFIASPNKGCAPLHVSFKQNSIHYAPIVSYFWDFGDGSTSTDSTPKHVFTKTGHYQTLLVIKNSIGCIDSVKQLIKAGEKPKADFTVNKRIGCNSDTVKFIFTNLTNNNAIKADSFFWDFGDGGVSFDENPVYPYRDLPGTYTVTLKAFNNGCVDSFVMKNYIEIRAPYANFTYKQAGCPPEVVTFKDSSVGATSIKWYFGDGTTSTAKNPTHVYKPGRYLARLSVYSSKTGCSDSTSTLIYVDTLSGFNILYGHGRVCAPDTVFFNSYSTDAIQYKWQFGDGDSSTEKNPMHIYKRPGKYTVTLNIITKDSCARETIKYEYIKLSGVDLAFNVTPNSGCLPLKVTLTDNSVLTSGIKQKYYDLGDGHVLPVTGKTMTYTYKDHPENQSIGYTITMNASDSGGCSTSITKTVNPLKPIASFQYKLDSVCLPVTYIFTPDITSKTGIAPYSFLWKFGDGKTSTSQNPSHGFAKDGTYNVTFIIKDYLGCQDSITLPVQVKKIIPKADFIADNTFASCPPLLVQFTDQSINGNTSIVRWEWDFGNGIKSNKPNPSVLYAYAGRFSVKLKVIDSVGCVDSLIMKDFILLNGPIGTYKYDITEGCVPLTVKFTANSANAKTYQWDVGDGSLLSGKEVIHTYLNPSKFIPSLILTDSFGCRVVIPCKDTIYAYSNPKARFNYTGVCTSSPFYFYDSSSNDDAPLAKWKWDFGDGNTSTLQNPVHQYRKSGQYSVSCITTTKHGCTDSMKKTLKISELVAKMARANKFNCIDEPVYFKDISISDTTIIQRFWDFGDSITSTDINPSHIFKTIGIHTIKLVVMNSSGCVDSVINDNFIVGDPASPPATIVYRATVLDDHNVELDFAPSYQVDFYGYIIYRGSSANNMITLDTIFNVNDTIFIDSDLNTLSTSYCYQVRILNACGKISHTSEVHCTINLIASPGINSSILNWNHYAGWDSVQQYDIYREGRGNGSYTQIGSVRGDTNSYIDSAITCYAIYNYHILATESGGYHQTSWSDTSATQPTYIPNVPAPFMRRATVIDNKDILIEWRHSYTRYNVKYFLLEKSQNGIKYSSIDSLIPSNQLQWIDKQVNVQVKPYYYRVRMIDSCGDISPYSNMGKSILLKVDTTVGDGLPILTWTKYLYWPNGVRNYEIEIKNANGDFIHLTNTATGDDTSFIDIITNLNSLPYYCYRVTAHEKSINTEETSTSNEGCTPVRTTIFAPNVFTPNNDLVNDLFVVKGRFIKEYNIKIYDRWGSRTFESNSIDNSWDGTYKKFKPIQDSYRYVIWSMGVDGHIRRLNGWVTVLP